MTNEPKKNPYYERHSRDMGIEFYTRKFGRWEMHHVIKVLYYQVSYYWGENTLTKQLGGTSFYHTPMMDVLNQNPIGRDYTKYGIIQCHFLFRVTQSYVILLITSHS